MRKHVLSLLFAVLFFFFPAPAHSAFPADAISSDNWISFDVPTHWYTGLTLDYPLTWYEYENRPESWSLSNAPSGMTIDSAGVLHWSSPSAGTYSSIQITATRPACNTTAYPSCSLTTTKTFDMVVGTSDTIFISTSGSDTGGCGSIGSPCAHLAYVIANLNSGTDGKLIFMRGGSYSETWSNIVFSGQAFTSTDIEHILPYPGESPTINATNWGLFLPDTSSYIVVAVPILGVSGDSGNYTLDCTHCMVRDVVTGQSRYDDNSTAISITGNDAIVNRVVAYDNWQGDGGASPPGWNNTGILAYNHAGPKDSWVMNSKSYNTEACFKIKHTNNDDSRTHFHNIEAINCSYGFLGAGKNSSLRFAQIWGTSVDFAATDPSSYTVQGMFIDHVTVKNTGGFWNMSIGGGYLTSGKFTLRHSISFQNGGACQSQNPEGANTRAHFVAWYYTTQSTADDYPFDSDLNLWVNTTGDSDCWHLGNTGAAAPVNFSGWKAFDADGAGTSIIRDPNSTSTTTDPFIAVGSGNVQVTTSSAAATACGSGYNFCGAFKPGRTDYGTVGNQNSTLLKWYESPATNPDDCALLMEGL